MSTETRNLAQGTEDNRLGAKEGTLGVQEGPLAVEVRRRYPEAFLFQLLSEKDVGDFWGLLSELADRMQPEMTIDRVAFFGYLDERIARSGQWEGDGRESVDVDALLGKVWLEDLLLAFGCARQQQDALVVFDKRYGGLLEAICRRYASQPSEVSDLLQVVREELFVGSSKHPPRIHEYLGKGFLENWLRVTTVRLLIDEHRRHRHKDRERPVSDLPDVASELDLELDFLKEHYRGEFRQAFAAAVAGLTSRERNLLRFQVLRGLTMEQLATIYRVHRATVVRQLSAARQHLLRNTRAALTAQLQLEHQEFESLMRLIQSHLDVSLNRVLRSQITLEEKEPA